MTPDFQFEQQLWTQGHTAVVGIDEVGRGALAGPVVVGAVIFDSNHHLLKGVNDSKLVSAQKRLELSPLLKNSATSWAIGEGSVELINEYGIMFALKHAVQQALSHLDWNYALMDGLPFKKMPIELIDRSQFIVKGDRLSYSIAAASIIAKVHRDQLMAKFATQHPEYGWSKNVGYGTKEHSQALASLGLTPHHRQLFCRKSTY